MENAKPRPAPTGLSWRRSLRWLCIAMLCFGALAGCRRDTPEQALRQQLQQMQAAVEAREPRQFMQGVSEEFTGNQGMDRAALHNLLRAQVLARSQIGTTTGPLEVTMDGDKATVKFSVLLTGGSGRLLPDSAQGYTITSGWRLEDGQWRVYYAQWTAA